jgi:hypothetical protein
MIENTDGSDVDIILERQLLLIQSIAKRCSLVDPALLNHSPLTGQYITSHNHNHNLKRRRKNVGDALTMKQRAYRQNPPNKLELKHKRQLREHCRGLA